jgi:hypothetical protein
MSPSGIAFSSLRCCHQPKPTYRATAAFLTPPLTSSSSRHSLNCRTTFPFIVAPPVLPSSLRWLPSSSRCFRHCATARFIIAPPLPSSLRRQFYLCVAPPRPSSSRRRSLPCRAAGFAFIITPLPVLHLSLRRRCLPCRAAAAVVIALPLASSLRRRSIF